jgi:hypothetical protein
MQPMLAAQGDDRLQPDVAVEMAVQFHQWISVTYLLHAVTSFSFVDSGAIPPMGIRYASCIFSTPK